MVWHRCLCIVVTIVPDRRNLFLVAEGFSPSWQEGTPVQLRSWWLECASKAAHITMDQEAESKARATVWATTFKGQSLVTSSRQMGPTSWKFHSFSKQHHLLGNECSKCAPVRTLQIQTVTGQTTAWGESCFPPNQSNDKLPSHWEEGTPPDLGLRVCPQWRWKCLQPDTEFGLFLSNEEKNLKVDRKRKRCGCPCKLWDKRSLFS